MNAKPIAIKMLAVILLGAAWAYPLQRLAHTLNETMKIYAEDGSINSWNDVYWNELVFAGYAMCIASGILAIAVVRRLGLASWVSFALVLLCGLYFCRAPFDGVIIIAPAPPIPIFAGLLCLACTVLPLLWNLKPHPTSSGKPT